MSHDRRGAARFLARFPVLGTALLAACGTDSFHDAGGAAEKPIYEAEFTEAWIIGGADSLGGITFDSPQGWFVGAIREDGLTLLIDRLAPSVLLLGPDGSLRSRISTRGQGPGEFQQPGPGGFVQDSLLWVGDANLQRITWFDLHGNLVSSERHSWEQVPASPWSARAHVALSQGWRLGEVGEIALGVEGEDLPYPVVLWDPAGKISVATWVERRSPGPRRVITASGVPVYPPQPFPAHPLVGAAPDGCCFFVLHRDPSKTDDGEILIERFTASGASMGTIRILYRALPVPETTRDRVGTMAAEYAERAPANLGVDARDVLEAMWIPDRWPPVQGAFMDSEGFWLHRESRRLWERYDMSGRLLARVELPDDFGAVIGITSHAIMEWRADAVGVPVVHMHRIRFRPLTS